jgi:hypothetical protein
MEFYANMTNADKVVFLTNVVLTLHKDIYSSCALSGIEPDSLNLENFNSEEFLSSFAENGTQSDWLARNAIVRSVEKLIATNKKLEELNNA